MLSNRVPFIRGGAEELSFNLVRRLREAGHQAEEMRIPFSWNPAERLIEEMVIARSLRLWNVGSCDRPEVSCLSHLLTTTK